MVWLVGALALATGLAGCQRRQAAPVPETRIGVVDLQAVTRAHPRWSELDAVVRQINDVQAQLASLPPLPAVLDPDVQRLLDAEAQRLRADVEKELEFLRQDGRRRLEAFADELRAEQEARLAQTRQDLDAQGSREIGSTRDALRAQLRAAEQEIRDEYRYPLLNLRLRAEVAGLTSEDEAKQLSQQAQALQDERERRIQAKTEELQRSFAEFQRGKEAEINAKLKAAQEALQAEAEQRLASRERETQAEFARAAAEMEKTFRARLERRRIQMMETAQAKLLGQQASNPESGVQRSRRLRAELAALNEQRLRLEDSILAEVKIEIAALAQEHRLDVVLTRYVANLTGIDITADVVHKLKR